MFYYLVTQFVPGFKATPLRLFDYTTFRAGAALFTAMLLCLFLGPLTVRLLKKMRTEAPTRLEGLVPEEFIDHDKDKTPSMGGILVIGSILVSVFLWGNPFNRLLWLFIGTLISFSLLGFYDDYKKISSKKKDGLSAKAKFALQIILSVIALFALGKFPEFSGFFNQFCVPLVKTPVWIMPTVIAFIFAGIVVVGTSNAVNLTDGKDGLAVGCTIFCVLVYGAFAYMSGHKIFAGYLDLNYIPGSSEVLVFTLAIAGSCMGFLWHNCHPASMFMGDTGSLALGAVIGLIAVLVKQEILLVLVGGVFVMEAGSVVLQVASMKLRNKRIFLCSPIHHHFERKGWGENQIVVRFWLLAGIFALLALATLKLR